MPELNIKALGRWAKYQSMEDVYAFIEEVLGSYYAVISGEGTADEILLTADDSNYDVSTADEFTSAINALNNNIGGGSITLMADITLTSDYDIKREISIIGNGHTISSAKTWTVTSTGTLTLGKLSGDDSFTFDGAGTARKSIIVVKGNLRMYDGVELTGRNAGSSADG